MACPDQQQILALILLTFSGRFTMDNTCALGLVRLKEVASLGPTNSVPRRHLPLRALTLLTVLHGLQASLDALLTRQLK